MWLRIVLIICGIIIVISVLQFLLSIHPPKHVSTNKPEKYENVSFKTEDGLTIRGWLLESKNASSTIIIGHGYPFDKGNILPVVEYLYPKYNLLLYDHRFFGESDGKISTVGAKETKDVQAAIEYVKEHKKGKIALYGFSLSASAMLMSKPDVDAIIADSPYANLENMAKQVYFIFGPLNYPFVWTTNILATIFIGINPKDISPAEAVKEINVPILLIHGDRDTEINVKNSFQIKKNNDKIDLWIIEGANHLQATGTDEYRTRISEFLRKHI